MFERKKSASKRLDDQVTRATQKLYVLPKK